MPCHKIFISSTKAGLKVSKLALELDINIIIINMSTSCDQSRPFLLFMYLHPACNRYHEKNGSEICVINFLENRTGVISLRRL